MIRLLSAFVLCCAAGVAQHPRENWDNLGGLTPGAEIRATLTGGKTVRGPFEKAAADAIVIKGTVLPRAGVRRVQLRSGRRGRNTLVGLGVGAGIGLATGAVLDAKAGEDGFAISAKAVLTCVGATVGALIGVGRSTWREVYRSP